jgi:hypothetical protein
MSVVWVRLERCRSVQVEAVAEFGLLDLPRTGERHLLDVVERLGNPPLVDAAGVGGRCSGPADYIGPARTEWEPAKR